MLKNNSFIAIGSVLGQGVHIETSNLLEDTLIQATKPDFCKRIFYCFRFFKLQHENF